MGQVEGKESSPEVVTSHGVIEHKAVRVQRGRMKRDLRNRRHGTWQLIGCGMGTKQRKMAEIDIQESDFSNQCTWCSSQVWEL